LDAILFIKTVLNYLLLTTIIIIKLNSAYMNGIINLRESIVHSV